MKPFGPPPFLPSNLVIFSLLLVAAGTLFFYNGDYKRMHLEKKKSKDINNGEVDVGIHQKDSSSSYLQSDEYDSLLANNRENNNSSGSGTRIIV